MKKILLTTLLASFIFTGCFPGCNSKQYSDEVIKLQEIANELNTYAAESYSSKKGTCTDYSIKKLDLINLKDYMVINNLSIEIKDNKPLILPNLNSGISFTKNDLVDILNKKDDIKKNIDLFIDNCNKNTNNMSTPASFHDVFKQMSMPSYFQIKNGVKFKISDNDTATIINGKTKCEKVFFDDVSEYACTEIITLDGSLSRVNLYTNGNVIEELWTVKNINGQISAIRPNGYSVQILKSK